MLIDAIIFNNENDMFEFRLKTLFPVVDKFVVVEATVTHAGEMKPLLFDQNRFSWAKEKLIYYPTKIETFDLNLDYVPKEYEPDAPQWKIENRQREKILEACKYFQGNDILMLSDCDEIPSREVVAFRRENNLLYPLTCDQRIVPYKLNYVSEHMGWRGTMMCDLAFARACGVQHLRNNRASYSPFPNGGWHFSYFGGAEQINRKILSFAHQELNRPEFTNLGHIEAAIATGGSLFGEVPPDFLRVEKDFYPQYILDNAPAGWWL